MAKKKLKNFHLTGLLFWLCLIILVAPFAVFGWILYSSSKDTGTPVLGNRYENDLDPAITKDQITQIEQGVAEMDTSESSFVTMPTATLRVYVNTYDAYSGDEVIGVAQAVYNKVTAVLDPEVYFTQHDGKKMYDLEVHVYNVNPENAGNEGVDYNYCVLVRTSGMSGPQWQLVSDPRDAELAQQLRDDVTARKEAEAAAAAEAEAQAAAEAEAAEEPAEAEEAAEGEEAESEEETEGEGE